MITLLFAQANKTANENQIDGLKLANKVVLSMVIRLAAEQAMINRLRQHYADENWWPDSNTNQSGHLMTDIRHEIDEHKLLKVLDQVSITVSSNIRLNSFMYEPIRDLTIEHLVQLYQRVNAFNGRDHATGIEGIGS